MADLNESDKLAIKHYGISEQEYLGKTEAEQIKILDTGFKKYVKARKNKLKPEFIENAKKELPKVKEFFEKQSLVYAKEIGASGGIGEYLIVGFLKGKYLLFNPKSEAKTLKTYQADENQIITSLNN